MPSTAEAQELADPNTSHSFLTLGKAESSPGPAATFPPAQTGDKGKEKQPPKSQGNLGQPQKCWVAASLLKAVLRDWHPAGP